MDLFSILNSSLVKLIIENIYFFRRNSDDSSDENEDGLVNIKQGKFFLDMNVYMYIYIVFSD